MTKTIYRECKNCKQLQTHRVGRRKTGKQGKARTKILDYCLVCRRGKE